ncbi:Hypothetical protein FKW44_017415 [Caligus rogercresseyi]|uniref:Uncharacterized protein n=1 Tax=Caligus rogercresseyi TaxID=217165 RepID=A0A7T8GTF4_CALRO|nr:Hypothetical protein FKW44_017415 [Caligus rogercresseyi]
MTLKLDCPYPECGTCIEHESEKVALALFEVHSRQHPQVLAQTAAPRIGKTPSCERPKIGYDTTEETWNSLYPGGTGSSGVHTYRKRRL